jgi:hypothetical protein
MNGYNGNPAADGMKAAREDDERLERVATVLAPAFERVQNPEHWKLQIDTAVVVTSRSELEDILEAVEFYTATVATVEGLYGVGEVCDSLARCGLATVRITAPGYYNGPAS